MLLDHRCLRLYQALGDYLGVEPVMGRDGHPLPGIYRTARGTYFLGPVDPSAPCGGTIVAPRVATSPAISVALSTSEDFSGHPAEPALPTGCFRNRHGVVYWRRRIAGVRGTAIRLGRDLVAACERAAQLNLAHDQQMALVAA